MAAATSRLSSPFAPSRLSRRPGALDLDDERVGQLDFGHGRSPPGNMHAEAREALELES